VLFLILLCPCSVTLKQLVRNCFFQLRNINKLKENSSAKLTFGLIKLWYLVNRSLKFVFMIIKCKEFSKEVSKN